MATGGTHSPTWLFSSELIDTHYQLLIDTNLPIFHRPNFDILLAAVEAAGLDGDCTSVFSAESPCSSPGLTTTPIPIGRQNKHLLEVMTDSTMSKTKNTEKGPVGDSPPKVQRSRGTVYHPNSVQHTYTTETMLCLICFLIRNHACKLSQLNFYNTVNDPDEDILNLSGIQEGEETLHASNLNSTIQWKIFIFLLSSNSSLLRQETYPSF